MANLRQRIHINALRYLLNKETHASTITSEVSNYDTYWIYFTPKEQHSEGKEGELREGPKPVKMLVEPEPDGPLRARRVRRLDEGKQKPKVITDAMIKGAEFEIRHFYGETETSYSSPATAAIARFFRMHWLFWLWHKFSKANASRKTKFMRERKTVLEVIVRLDDERRSPISNLSVAQEIRGPDVFLLPKEVKARYFRHILRIIESLAFTEEIVFDKNRNTYAPTGKSMASLLEWETELRIHRSQVRRERMIVGLTLIIAFGTTVQAYQAIVGSAL